MRIKENKKEEYNHHVDRYPCTWQYDSDIDEPLSTPLSVKSEGGVHLSEPVLESSTTPRKRLRSKRDQEQSQSAPKKRSIHFSPSAKSESQTSDDSIKVKVENPDQAVIVNETLTRRISKHRNFVSSVPWEDGKNLVQQILDKKEADIVPPNSDYHLEIANILSNLFTKEQVATTKFSSKIKRSDISEFLKGCGFEYDKETFRPPAVLSDEERKKWKALTLKFLKLSELTSDERISKICSELSRISHGLIVEMFKKSQVFCEKEFKGFIPDVPSVAFVDNVHKVVYLGSCRVDDIHYLVIECYFCDTPVLINSTRIEYPYAYKEAFGDYGNMLIWDSGELTLEACGEKNEEKNVDEAHNHPFLYKLVRILHLLIKQYGVALENELMGALTRCCNEISTIALCDIPKPYNHLTEQEKAVLNNMSFIFKSLAHVNVPLHFLSIIGCLVIGRQDEHTDFVRNFLKKTYETKEDKDKKEIISNKLLSKSLQVKDQSTLDASVNHLIMSNTNDLDLVGDNDDSYFYKIDRTSSKKCIINKENHKPILKRQ
ncbi:hypothetical protein AKO1_009224 [Acrasis kona]|uniref:Uncharacterized protein n=1 Tax=Acrasis kona TaxID=1008807 RepID=A0AAW2ZKW9_9EUKA